MAHRSASLARSLISTARSSSSFPRLRPTPQTSPFQTSHLGSRRLLSTTLPRTIGVLGCAHSLLPLCSAVASSRLRSHILVEARACCELSQGT